MMPLAPAVNDQRNSITSALMNIARPPPQMPLSQIQPQVHMGMPQVPMPGAPPMGAPIPQMPTPTLPLTAGVSPQPMQQGMQAPQSPMPQQPAAPQPPMPPQGQ